MSSDSTSYFCILMPTDLRSELGHYARRNDRSSASAARHLIRAGLEADQLHREQRQATRLNIPPDIETILDSIDAPAMPAQQEQADHAAA